ncbi:MAG: large conductance mechanosensitive channel protein MscL [Euryarchaeota archaeon]|nr:large conductance mechanosensitive channel protein MscL [Euryarchaeota archaeon]
MGFFSEFKEFAVKGNMVDLAVGIIIGAAFGAAVNSLVTDVISPPIGLLFTGDSVQDLHYVLREGREAGPYGSLEEARAAGAVVIAYGLFLNAVVSFLLVAIVLFFVVRTMNRLRRKEESPSEPSIPERKTCPHCLSSIPDKATRCAQCTAELG